MPTKCREREKILAKGVSDIPALPIGAIRGNLCFRCFSPTSLILKCSGCKRAGYCSKACQKLDWTIMHKKHCKIFQSINEHEEEQYKESRTWGQYREYLFKTVRSIQDALEQSESEGGNGSVLRDVVQAQAYCVSCRRTAVQLSSRKIALTPCDRCRLVFNCATCPSPPAHSPAVCDSYQNHAHIEQFRNDFFEDTGKASPVTCTQFPREDRKLLENSSGWYDYYVNISDKPQIKDIIKPDFSGLSDTTTTATATEKEDYERMRMFLMCATDNLTMPLTILSSLEEISWDKPELNIHLLGATGRELLALGNFEEILHLAPGIKSLNITAAGPSSWKGDSDQTTPFFPKVDLDCCPVCKSDGRSRSVASYRGLYHDFAASSDYRKPDLIVLFNSGWVDGDDSETHWLPTIEMVVESGVPALFTTYNAAEAMNEKAKMREMGACFVVEPGRNKWSGLVPMPEFIDVEFDMWFQNSHRYVVKGKRDV